ncbi:MAG: hypothetical protein AAGC86_06875 [Pseudomonadota bacterium]
MAEAIARIDEQLALRDALLQEKDALDQALSVSSLPGIGDNQGPPLEDRAVLPDFVSISFSIDQLTTALDKSKLEHARVQSLAEKLLEVVNGAKRGLLALAGLTIGGVAAAAGWDIYSTGGEQLIANLDRIAELAERVRQFALQ